MLPIDALLHILAYVLVTYVFCKQYRMIKGCCSWECQALFSVVFICRHPGYPLNFKFIWIDVTGVILQMRMGYNKKIYILLSQNQHLAYGEINRRTFSNSNPGTTGMQNVKEACHPGWLIFDNTFLGQYTFWYVSQSLINKSKPH